MFSYLAKQSIRSNKHFLTRFGLFYLVMAVMAVLAIAFMVDMGIDPRLYIVQISIVVAAIGSYYVFMGKYNGLRMHPATFHNTFNSKRFKLVMFAIATKAFAVTMVFCVLLVLAINAVALSETNFIYFASLAAFMSGCLLLKWIRHKAESAVGMVCAFACFAMLCGGFIAIAVTDNAPFLLLQIAALMLAFVLNAFLQMNWGPYLGDMRYLAFINHAVYSNDMALMQQIATERLAEKKRLLSLCVFPLTRRNAIFYKAVIDFVRMDKRFALVIALLAVITFSMRTLDMFPTIPLVEIDLGYALSALFVTALATIIFDTFTRNLASLFDKHRCGFTLPYADKKIISGYFTAASIAVNLFYILVAVIHNAPILRILLALPLANLLMFLNLYAAYRSKKKNRIIAIMFSVMLYILSSFLI